MNKQNPALKKAMLAALEKHLGIVSQAAKTAGIDRNAHYLWIKDDEEYAKAVKALDDITLDFAESSLYSQVKEGNTTATIFLLKTKGRKRGYDERITIEAKEEATKKIVVVYE